MALNCPNCGATLDGAKFCPNCGTAAPAPSPAAETAVAGGELVWSFRIPIVNNRDVWIHWGWVSLLFVAISAVGFVLLFTLAFPGTELRVLVRAFIAMAILEAGIIAGMGLFGALAGGNHIRARFTLDSSGARSTGDADTSEIASLSHWLLGEKWTDANATAGTIAMLLPESGSYEWKDIRSATFDDRRTVITLHRGWHRKLRLYATPENYQVVAAFVRGHVRPPFAAAPPVAAS